MGIIKDDFLKEEKAKAEAKQKSKYEEALSKYNTDIDDRPCRRLCARSSPRRCLRTTPWR